LWFKTTSMPIFLISVYSLSLLKCIFVSIIHISLILNMNIICDRVFQSSFHFNLWIFAIDEISRTRSEKFSDYLFYFRFSRETLIQWILPYSKEFHQLFILNLLGWKKNYINTTLIRYWVDLVDMENIAFLLIMFLSCFSIAYTGKW
jgi:hypothetical protein